MNPNLLIGLLVGILGHVLLLFGVKVNLVEPGPGPSRDALFVLVSAQPDSVRSDATLLHDPSVFFLPSRVSMRPALGRYGELIEPSVFFETFKPDTSKSLASIEAMRFGFLPGPGLRRIAREGPVIDFSLERAPLSQSPRPETRGVTVFVRNLARPGSRFWLESNPSGNEPTDMVSLHYQMADPRLARISSIRLEEGEGSGDRLPGLSTAGLNGYFSVLRYPKIPPEPKPE